MDISRRDFLRSAALGSAALTEEEERAAGQFEASCNHHRHIDGKSA